MTFDKRSSEHDITGDTRIDVRPEEFPAAVAITEEAGLKLRDWKKDEI
ncbi:Orn/DAP/Arg decarboxylase 2 [Calothrix sp. NIES-2100]|nr:Orn/DAP/Arg decarboxylase 2 [Calothrix sp. NIES-2100]